MTQIIRTPGTYTRKRDGWTAEIQWVAGGMFSQVIIRDADGNRVASKTHQYSSAAEAHVRGFLAEK